MPWYYALVFSLRSENSNDKISLNTQDTKQTGTGQSQKTVMRERKIIPTLIMGLLPLVLPILGHTQENLDAIEKESSSTPTLRQSDNHASYMSLRDAIEQGLRENISEQIRKYEFEIQELDFTDAKQDFYYPKLSLTIANSADHFTENLYRDPIENDSSAKTPNGYVGLELEDYTLFNWGRDYLDFLNAEETYKRNKQNIQEEKRSLRFQIILAYFNLARYRKVSNVSKQQLRHASFIYRLSKEQLSLRKINSQEFLQTKAEFLVAHKNYHSSLADYTESQRLFAEVIGSSADKHYAPSEQIKYAPLIINEDDAIQVIKRRNPELLEARKNLNNANRSYQKTIKDNLPLPRFTLKLGSYKRAFSQNGVTDEYETFSGSRNVEIAASLNMKWTIFGSGGLFNSRVTEKSYYNKKIAELKLRDSKRQIDITNKNLFSKLKYLEKEFQATQALMKNSQKVFDKALDNYISRKTSFMNIKYVLDNLYDSSLQYENLKYEHMLEKVSLALLMGVDDFPGEKFESMVVK